MQPAMDSQPIIPRGYSYPEMRANPTRRIANNPTTACNNIWYLVFEQCETWRAAELNHHKVAVWRSPADP